MTKISPIYIAFGGNLANPVQSFIDAEAALRSHGVTIARRSGLWQSPAWPAGSGQPDYINAVAEVRFDGQPRALLSILHAVEAEFGRKRDVLNAARVLDLDLLDFRRQVMDHADITIPHPRMMARGFVLFPLSEIAPAWIHPVTGQGLEAAVARLPLADVMPMRRLGAWTADA